MMVSDAKLSTYLFSDHFFTPFICVLLITFSGDLFKAGSSIKSNAKIIGSGVTTTKKPSPLKTQSKFDSLFNDVEDDDLFEDPLTKGKAN